MVMKVDNLLRRACWDGQQWIDSLIQANHPDDDCVPELKAYAEELRKYRHKRWGKSTLEVFDEGLVKTSLEEIAERGKQ